MKPIFQKYPATPQLKPHLLIPCVATPVETPVGAVALAMVVAVTVAVVVAMAVAVALAMAMVMTLAVATLASNHFATEDAIPAIADHHYR